MFAGHEALGRTLPGSGAADRNFGFGNMHQLMTDLHEGNRKSLPCGAGVGLLAVDKRWRPEPVPPLHRVGPADCSATSRPGSTSRGWPSSSRSGWTAVGHRLRDLPHPQHLLRRLLPRELRPLRATRPTRSYHYCELLRDWVEFGIRCYARISGSRTRRFSTPTFRPGGARDA